MPFHHFADPLDQCFLDPVSCRGAVKFVDRVKPVEGDQKVPAPGQIIGPGPLKGDRREDLPGDFRFFGFIMHGARDHFKGNGAIAEVGVPFDQEVLGVLGEGEEAESLCKLHHGTGFGLVLRASLAHLLFGADRLQGVLAADAEINRNPEAACVDPQGALKDMEVQLLEFGLEPGQRFFRGNRLVLIEGVALESVP